MMDLKVGGNTLGTESPLIYGKVIAGLKAYDTIFFDQKVHPTLHSAVWAVSRDDLIDRPVGLPASVRCVVQVRAELVYYPFEVLYF